MLLHEMFYVGSLLSFQPVVDVSLNSFYYRNMGVRRNFPRGGQSRHFAYHF